MTVDPAISQSQAVVQITLGQVYSEVTGMRAEFRDLANSVRTAVTQLGDHETRLRTVEKILAPLEDADARIGALQRLIWTAVGIGLALSVGGSWLLTIALSKR